MLRLGTNVHKEIWVVETKIENNLIPINVQNVTDDFYRCVVHNISEVKEFEVDGMKFRATCERIE